MDVDLENIADVLRKANIRVTTVGERYFDLECSQTEAELARDITRQMTTPVITLYEIGHNPTDYPRTWKIKFKRTVEEVDDIHRRRSALRKSRTAAAHPDLPNQQDHQSSGIQDNSGTDGTPDHVPGFP